MAEVARFTQQTHENTHIVLNQKKSFEESKSNVLQMMNNFITENDAIKFLNWIKDEALEELQRFLLRADLNYQDQIMIDQSVDKMIKSDMIKIEGTNNKSEITIEESMESSSMEEPDYKYVGPDPLKVEETTNFISESMKTTEIDSIQKLNFSALLDNKPALKMEETNLQNHFPIIDLSIDSDRDDEYSQSLDSSQFEEQEDFKDTKMFVLKKEIVEDDSYEVSVLEQNTQLILPERTKEITDKKEKECNSCGKYFSKPSDLKRHINAVHNGHKEHKCDPCGKLFSQAAHLKTHIHTIHEGRKDYTCDSCGKSFSKTGNLNRHINASHHQLSKFFTLKDNKSDPSDKLFSQEGQLQKNIDRVHEGHKEYACVTCGKSFSKPSDLERHINAVHYGYKDYKCDPCGKSFSQAAHLKTHIHNVHEGHKDYKCDSCGKSFSQSGELKTHIRSVHEGRKDYICDPCNKAFSQAGHLTKHIRTVHEGHKDYVCNSCGKSFTESGTLKRHLQTIHNGYKVYKCTICGKSFSQSGNLKQHIHTVHEDHKLCDSCGKSFSKPADLKMHIHDIHTILEGHKDYWCDPCGKSFSESELKKHIQIVHESRKVEKIVTETLFS